MGEWQPIETAPKNGEKIHARDADGNDRVTWCEDGIWAYASWRENDDRDEYETEEWWEPTEWHVPPNARSKRRRRQVPHSAQKQRAGVRLTELLGGSHLACNPMGR